MDKNYCSKQKVDEMFKIFLKEVSYANQGYIYLIKNTVKTNIVK